MPVSLRLPEDVTPATRLVAEDLALLMGLRFAAGDLRSVPYAIRWRAATLGLSHTTVRRALRDLADAGAVVRGDSLPADRGYPRGTATFLPAPDAVTVDCPPMALGQLELIEHAAKRARPGTRHWWAHWLANRLADRGGPLDNDLGGVPIGPMLWMQWYVDRVPPGDHPYTEREAGATLRSVWASRGLPAR